MYLISVSSFNSFSWGLSIFEKSLWQPQPKIFIQFIQAAHTLKIFGEICCNQMDTTLHNQQTQSIAIRIPTRPWQKNYMWALSPLPPYSEVFGSAIWSCSCLDTWFCKGIRSITTLSHSGICMLHRTSITGCSMDRKLFDRSTTEGAHRSLSFRLVWRS